MTAEVSARETAPRATAAEGAHSNIAPLHSLAVAAGLFSAALFVVVGLVFRLEEYGDGSLFSYAVAVDDAWAFHWHNISGRIFVYLFCYLPAEAYVALARNASGGIALYGLLYFGSVLLGLVATFFADRSKNRILFAYACASAASLCPLVFGAPTEMWMAHALFWPALALCHFARRGAVGMALVGASMLALILCHEGAVILEICILCTLLLRGWHDGRFLRGATAFALALAVWFVVKTAIPPDAYDTPMLARAAWGFFDLGLLRSNLFLLLAAALFAYAIVFACLHRSAKAPVIAASLVGAALLVYWLRFDHALHAENRYYMRTALLVGMLALGSLASLQVLVSDNALRLPIPLLPQLKAFFSDGRAARFALGAFVLVFLVHVVETAKFVRAWRRYEDAVRALAMSDASDPQLGDPRFVSSARIGADLNRLAWFSSTQFLSVLVAPNFRPARLVMDPRDPRVKYYWLPCPTATANEAAQRAVPVESRRLVRIIPACIAPNDRLSPPSRRPIH